MMSASENLVNGKLTIRPVQRFGWVPDLPDARDFLYSAPEAVLASLPTKVDLRSKMPRVYDQGHLGSCTANAIGAAFEFDLMKQRQRDFMPSRLFIYYNERVMEGTVGTDAGAMIRDGIKSVVKQGACPESDWKYVITKFAKKPRLLAGISIEICKHIHTLDAFALPNRTAYARPPQRSSRFSRSSWRPTRPLLKESDCDCETRS